MSNEPNTTGTTRSAASLGRVAAVLLVFLVPFAGCATAPAVPAGLPNAIPHRPPTLWTFLGVDCVFKYLNCKHERCVAKLGQTFPDLEPTLPLLLNTSPEAATSPSVAIQNTAHVLAEEQLAPQKIKAVKAAAQVGSAAYPQVEEALLAGLDDRNAKVRLATVKAILSTAGNQRCDDCDRSGNCTPAIRRKLWELGYGIDPDGCPLEPSPPVRRVARLALNSCGGPVPEPPPEPQPRELPPPEVLEAAESPTAGNG